MLSYRSPFSVNNEYCIDNDVVSGRVWGGGRYDIRASEGAAEGHLE